MFAPIAAVVFVGLGLACHAGGGEACSSSGDVGLTTDGERVPPAPDCAVSVPTLHADCRRGPHYVSVSFSDVGALKAHLGAGPDETFGTELQCGTFFTSGAAGLQCTL